jgi:hypothetical protein
MNHADILYERHHIQFTKIANLGTEVQNKIDRKSIKKHTMNGGCARDDVTDFLFHRTKLYLFKTKHH